MYTSQEQGTSAATATTAEMSGVTFEKGSRDMLANY